MGDLLTNDPLTKLLKLISFHWSWWPQEMKKRQALKRFLLLNSLTDFEIISLKCSLSHSLPKLLKPSIPPYITYHFICTIWIRWATRATMALLLFCFVLCNLVVFLSCGGQYTIFFYLTVFTLIIRTPQLLTIHVLIFEKVLFTTFLTCLNPCPAEPWYTLPLQTL